MENPAEYVVIGAKTVWALIGGSGLASALGVWLLARFTSTFDAYAGERAKIEAQFQNVEKLVANTEKLTAATETIKAKLTDETWDKQQRKTKRSDCYADLAGKLNAVVEALIPLRACAHLLSQLSPNDQFYAAEFQEQNEKAEHFLVALADLNRAKAAALLVCGNDPLRIVMMLTYPPFESSKHAEMDILLDQSARRTTDTLHAFVMVVRSELGYEPLGDAL